MRTRLSACAPTTAALFGVLVAACAGSRAQTMVASAGLTPTEEGTVAVSVTRVDSECRRENRCAEVEAIRTLLFVGVPGSAIQRAMVANETAALEKHAVFFRQLFDEGGHARYVTASTRGVAPAGAPDDARVWTVVVNHEALRIALEKQGVIRKFGY
jgi:hypothetical protein